MRAPYEALVALRACVTELDPHAMKLAIYGRMRGGLPTSSMSDGRGNADIHEPELDEHDTELVATRDDYERRLDKLATDALELRKIQRDMLYRQFRPAPKSKEFVRSELKSAADEYDRTHNLEVGTTWANEQQQLAPEKIEWCLSCGRVKGHLSPVADVKRGGKDCVLCWWCLQYARQHDSKWPPFEMIEARAQGRPVRVKVKPS